MKKFDMITYTKRRMKELRGEKVYAEPMDGDVARYTRQRMVEIYKTLEDERLLDKSPLRCYAVSTMGDRDGDT